MTPHDLHALGLCVIPVPRPGGGHDGKRPTIAWSEFQRRRPTKEELDAWFGGAPMNLAIVTGAISGIVVVDLDDDIARRWWTRHRPRTPWQVRTRRGFHAYYGHPGEAVSNFGHNSTIDALAIDVRGDGGYVIGPSSVHATGHVYELAGDWTQPREALPVFDPEWHPRLFRPSRPAPPARTSPPRSVSTDVLTRARCYLAAIPVPEIGMGSDNATFYAACRLVRGFGLDPSSAEALLWEWAGGRAGWTRDWIAAKVRAAEQYGSEAVRSLCVH